jgi:anti-sigma B factor antagonist
LENDHDCGKEGTVEGLRLETNVRSSDGFPILEVSGEIDIFTAPLFKQAVAGLVTQGHRHVFIDMTGVGFMDSSGFSTLLSATKRLRPQGGALHLFRCSPPIEKMLHLIRLDTILGIYADEAAAIAAVQSGSGDETAKATAA